jgi:UDP-N-acetylglucosamine/UDP-N-acetylgalactosamine diphosphorylase
VLPAIDVEGKIMMKTPSKIQLSPNGNGALFQAISSNYVVMNHVKNVDYVQVIGVDNVLNKVLDPVHVGFTALKDLDASLKCCIKRNPEEKVGVVCKKNGKYDIVEYSEFSEDLAKKLDPDDPDRLYFELGNILMFMIRSKKLI